MILEKAEIQYDKNGNYDYTINTYYKNFRDMKDIKKYINDNIETNVEFYIYDNKEDIEKGNHKEVIICNNLLKGENMENKIMYIDTDSNDIYKENEIRIKDYNVNVQDLVDNQNDIMEGKRNIDSIFENIKKTFTADIKDIIKDLNENWGYNIETWKRIN